MNCDVVAYNDFEVETDNTVRLRTVKQLNRCYQLGNEFDSILRL